MARVPVEERRAQLREATMRVVAREGVAAATTRRIAAEAGVSLGIVHYAYRSKDELLGDVAIAVTRQLEDAVTAAILPDAPVAENLRRGMEAIWKVVEAEPEAQIAPYELTTFCLRDPSLTDVAARQYAGYTLLCRQVLEAVAEAGRVRFDADLGVLARLLESVLDGGMIAWLADRDTLAALAAYDLFIDYLVGLARPLDRDQNSDGA